LSRKVDDGHYYDVDINIYDDCDVLLKRLNILKEESYDEIHISLIVNDDIICLNLMSYTFIINAFDVN
jgi:hypothetical protein